MVSEAEHSLVDPSTPSEVQDNEKTGVIDIGSNSIRLVVFEGLTRAPAPVFNEKLLCGLGRGLDESGRLNEEGRRLALTNLVRFVRLADAMRVRRLDLLGTAALREASDGMAFVEEIKALTGRTIRVLSGEEEARLAALGVLSGTPDADGIIGDLGGGSLELVEVHEGAVGRQATLPLGPLRMAGTARDKVVRAIREHLAQVSWLAEGKGRNFYPVGGAWRNLARIHMDQTGYPLHVIQGYSLRRVDAQSFAKVVSTMGQRSLSRLKGVSRRRRETLPHAALVLDLLLELTKSKLVTFSTFGLREGHLYDQLPKAEQARDPLLAMSTDLAARESRFGDLGDALIAWTDPLLGEETEQMLRLRWAAAHLSDIAWREHPDYRAIQALRRILHFPLVGVDHRQRTFLAYSVFVRYGGQPEEPEAQSAGQLLSQDMLHSARVLGLAFRLAYRLCGATIELLKRTGLQRAGDRLQLVLPADGSVLSGDMVEREIKALVTEAGLKDCDVVSSPADSLVSRFGSSLDPAARS